MSLQSWRQGGWRELWLALLSGQRRVRYRFGRSGRNGLMALRQISLFKAYLDGPKSHEELQGNVGKAEKGYEVHHMVEQTAASREGHSQEDIDGPDNLVRIPTLKHWEITGWYMMPNERYNYHSPELGRETKIWLGCSY